MRIVASVALSISLSFYSAPARAASDDGGWPRRYQSASGAQITLYQPHVMRVGDLYDMCYEGVWFVGNSPSGPWQVADSIPQAAGSVAAVGSVAAADANQVRARRPGVQWQGAG